MKIHIFVKSRGKRRRDYDCQCRLDCDMCIIRYKCLTNTDTALEITVDEFRYLVNHAYLNRRQM